MMRDSAQDYLRSLDTGETNQGQVYNLRVMAPRQRANPDIDYMKMVIMILGAVVAGILYDRKNRN